MLAARAAALALLTALATAAVQRLVTDPLTRFGRAGVHAAAERDPATLVLPLDELVLGGAALALMVCWIWMLLGVGSAALSVVTAALGPHPGTPGARPVPRLGPRWARTVSVVALGVTALQAPAYAEPSGERAVPAASSAGDLGGLPLPDRATLPVEKAPSLARTGSVASAVLVQPGDSLWSIAAGLLPANASTADVDRAWRALAAANSGVLGPDPDLIFPGTALSVPPLDRLLGKDRP